MTNPAALNAAPGKLANRRLDAVEARLAALEAQRAPDAASAREEAIERERKVRKLFADWADPNLTLSGSRTLAREALRLLGGTP